jgi:hypothetical protein
MKDLDVSTAVRQLVDSIGENGELPFLKRRWLHEYLKQQVATEKKENAVWLALENISAHRTQDIWEHQFPSEHGPLEVLEIADNYLVTGDRTESLHTKVPEVKSILDDKLLLGPDSFRAVYAGFACWAAARNVAYGGQQTANDGDSELEIDPEQWDASFYASLAYAGGAVWEEKAGNPDKRRQFWIWFICEAVPLAVSVTSH